MPELPDHISKCWQNGGYHANMAGPCFDTIEQAVTHRDNKAREWAEELDRRVIRYPYLRRQYDAEGWPDGREVMGENIMEGTAPKIVRERLAAITHCPRNHEYTPENTMYRMVQGYRCRVCRECNRARNRKAS